MKNLVVTVLALCAVYFVSAQEKQLENARLETSINSLQPTHEPNVYKYSIKEGELEDFLRDPVEFVEENFNADELVRLSKENKYHEFDVTFNCPKGYLTTRYTKDGKLIKTKQVFKDLRPPGEIMSEIYKNHKGWTVVKIKHIAIGTADRINSDLYKIKLRKGKKVKHVRLRSPSLDSRSIVNN